MVEKRLISASVVGELQPEKLTAIDVSILTPASNFGSVGGNRLFNDTFVDDLDGEAVWQPDVYNEAIVLSERLRLSNIIDLGCGNGDKLIALKRDRSFKVIGVDFNGSLDVAKSRYPEYEWLNADFLNLDNLHVLEERLKDYLPAVIILSDVIEHLPDVRPILNLIRNLIAFDPNSYVLISTPDRERQNYEDTTDVPGNSAHIREWTLRELVQLVSNAGLEVSRAGWTRCNQWDEFFTTIIIQATYNVQRHRRRLCRTFSAPEGWAPEHLLITSELHGFTPSGGIGSFVVEQRDNYGESRTLLLVASQGIISDVERPVFALLPEEICVDADMPSLPIEDRILRAVTSALFLFPAIKTIEFQDYQGIGCRVAQAKRAGIIPLNVTVVVHCHGNTHYLENGRREWLGRSHIVTSIKEKISVENADVVCFPSRFLRDLYRDAGIDVDRRKCEFRRYPYTGKFISPASTHRIDTLIFFGKRTFMKGYKLFLDALTSDNVEELHARGLRRIVIIGPRTQETNEWEAAFFKLKTVFTVEEYDNLVRYEAIECIRANAERCLVVMPYIADNYPLSVLDSMSAGALPIVVNAGGVPEMLPPRFLQTLVSQPDPKSLRRVLERLLSISGPAIARVRQAFFATSYKRQIAINDEAKAPFELSSNDGASTCLTAAVVIPFFNTPTAQVELLLRSLFCQTRRPEQIIIVDDASCQEAKDDLSILISKFSKHSHILKVVVHDVNQGLASARNTALRTTTADVLINVDSDDIVLNCFIAGILQTMESNPDVDAAVPYLMAFDDGTDVVAGELNGYVYRPLGDGVVASQTDNLLGHANSGFRVQKVRELGGWDPTARAMWEDYALYMRLVSSGSRIAVIPRADVLYRVTPKSMARTYARWPAMRLLARNLVGLPRFDAFRLQAVEREREHLELTTQAANQEVTRLYSENSILKDKVAQLENLSESITQRMVGESARAADLDCEIEKNTARIKDLESDQENVLQLRNENEWLLSETMRLKSLVSETSDRLDAVWKVKTEYFEPELASRDVRIRELETSLSQSNCLRDENTRLISDVERLELLAGETSDRLDAVWKVKTEYLEPELSYRDIRIRRLEFSLCEARKRFLQLPKQTSFKYLFSSLFSPRRTKVESRRQYERCIVATSGLFDPTWYRQFNSDLGDMDPLEHYILHGAFEGRSPSQDFDGNWYLDQYPDVAAAGQNPLVHYIEHGSSEGRSIRRIISTG
ncbi:MAG: glycosyltransferase [Methylobacterium sp.]|uniref:glycosyltransferase n=1 Tax=Methylobacterium sp. TaxID=409 RepID=UPI0025EFECD6|nr:glycosyltransferase [Methylobacterium sp.]MBX9933753.1 glycosyltransferase [Methylobacterium sp.]